jgi:hypothetical protein
LASFEEELKMQKAVKLKMGISWVDGGWVKKPI